MKQLSRLCIRHVFLLTALFWNITSSQAQYQNALTKELDLSNITSPQIGVLIDNLNSLSDVNLSYNQQDLDLKQEVDINLKSPVTVEQVLEAISKAGGLTYKQIGKQIILKKKPSSTSKKTYSGYIRDAGTGEALIGVLIRLIDDSSIGTATNLYGYYSITVPSDSEGLVFSYMGYKTKELLITDEMSEILTVELTEAVSELEAVLVSDRRQDANITANRMSVEHLNVKQIEGIPVLFGEVDLIKVLKLLPGVQMTGETSSGFSVRGGNFDQNLILLDEAVVYNPSHLLGLFSTFNNDAINSVNFYKGVFPVKYGGRVSSVVDVRMKEGNSKQFSAKGGISLISSRLTLEAPIVKNKGSIMLSGRRTYADLIYRTVRPSQKSNKLYFYDFNGKANYSINENNKFYLSAYTGRDILKTDNGSESPAFDWGNVTTTARWNHIYSNRLFSNLSAIYSNYDYKLGLESENFSFSWKSRLTDYSIKMDFDYNANEKNAITFGFASTIHDIRPGLATLESDQESGTLNMPKNLALEHGIYIGNEQKINSKLTVNYGVRFTMMQNMGKTKSFTFDENFETKDTIEYKKGEIYNTYAGFEPRINGSYLIDKKQSIKAGYSRTRQFLHLASNSISGTPLDIWIPSSPNVKPQIADQFSVGYFRNLLDNKIEISTEFYYKSLRNQIDFQDHATIFLNEELEGELRFGKAQAYGAEIKISKPKGRWNGWISYTLARSQRTFADIANGEPYLSPFDRTHNVSVVGSYDLTKRLSISGNWVFFSGLPLTAPSGRFVYGGEVIPTYTKRNGDRLPNYHRLDVGITLEDKKNTSRRFQSSWNLSVYNAYNRRNANIVRFESSDANSAETRARQTSIFPIIPTITWNFEF